MKVFFTETESNLAPSEAGKMGVHLIKKYYVHKGEAFPVEHLPIEYKIDEREITTAVLGVEEYKEYFAPYAGKEIIFVAHPRKLSAVLGNLASQQIPGLTIIETGFVGQAMIEVLKRVVDCKPYDDIRCFIVTKNPNKKARLNTAEKYTLLEMKDGEFFPIKSSDAKKIC